MTAAAVTPAAPMPARTFPNRYTCSCDTCGASVARGEGSVRRATRRDRAVRDAGRRWVVTCATCADAPAVSLPAVSPAVTSLVSVAMPAAPAVDTSRFVQPAVIVPAREPGQSKTPDGYTVTSHGNVRCKGCGMVHGGGHYADCNRRYYTDRRVYSDAWRKPATKPGSAAHAKLAASVATRLGMIETDDRGYIAKRTNSRAFK